MTHLTAEIQLSDRATVVAAGNITQNFSKPIFYTVTTTNGVKKVYQIVIYFTKQNNPVISSFSKDTVRAGEHLIVSGWEFGNFNLAVKVHLLGTNEESQE